MKLERCSRILQVLLIFLLSVILYGCNEMVLMHPKGQIGIEQRSLILISLGTMIIVVIPAIIMAIVFSIRYRSSNIKALYNPDWSYSNRLEIIIWSVPVLIVFFLAIITWKSTHALDPSKPISSNDVQLPITIEVISLDWKWLFFYPDQNIATINEISFPVNTPIKFKITSNSVMNSFFIPQLGSQVYAMAGMESLLNLIANKSGIYKGISSNFSGKGFSGMKFVVIVTKNEKEFKHWIQTVKSSPNQICTVNEYEILAKPSEFHEVKYFSKIKPNLFNDIIKKTMNSHKKL